MNHYGFGPNYGAIANGHISKNLRSRGNEYVVANFRNLVLSATSADGYARRNRDVSPDHRPRMDYDSEAPVFHLKSWPNTRRIRQFTMKNNLEHTLISRGRRGTRRK